MITLIFPSASQFPMPNGAYYRNAAGEIVLTCTREELAAALLIADAINAHRPRAATATVAPATETDRIMRSIAQPGDRWVVRR